MTPGTTEPPPAQAPLITHVVGCLIWWPLVALACVVIFPSLGGSGVVLAGVGLLTLRLAHLTWELLTSTAGESDVARG